MIAPDRRWGKGALRSAALVVALALGIATQAPTAASARASAPARSRIVFSHKGALRSITPAGDHTALFGRAGGPSEIPAPLGTPDIAASRDGRRVAVLQFTGTDGAHGDNYRVILFSQGARRARQVWSYGPIQRPGAGSVALSPDGRLLAISLWRRILIQNLDTGDRRFLATPDGFYDIQPSFTADGRHLVFCRGEQPEPLWQKPPDIYLRPLAGEGARMLVHTKNRAEFFPVLSPDGRRLAFLRRAHGNHFALIVAHRDGTEAHVLYLASNLLTRPDFSPDGKRIAYGWVKSTEYVRNPLFSLVTVGVDGADPRTVLQVHGGPLYPQWTLAP
jgi:Tol biopolymer transport system component